MPGVLEPLALSSANRRDRFAANGHGFALPRSPQKTFAPCTVTYTVPSPSLAGDCTPTAFYNTRERMELLDRGWSRVFLAGADLRPIVIYIMMRVNHEPKALHWLGEIPRCQCSTASIPSTAWRLVFLEIKPNPDASGLDNNTTFYKAQSRGGCADASVRDRPWALIIVLIDPAEFDDSWTGFSAPRK